MSSIPPPPLDDAGLVRIGVDELARCCARGPASGCLMCPELTWSWLDLTRADMPPVTDRYGALTDQVPLHPACAPTLAAHWAMLLFKDSGGEDAAAPPAVAEPAVGVRSIESEPVPAAVPVAPMGRYARQGTM